MSSSTGSRPRRRTDGEFTIQELALLDTEAPQVCRLFLEQKRLDQRHRHRIAWADLIAQTVGHISGLAALAILALVAWHAFNRGAATQGAAIICTGAVSIVAVFVTGRLTGGRARRTNGAASAPVESSDPT